MILSISHDESGPTSVRIAVDQRIETATQGRQKVSFKVTAPGYTLNKNDFSVKLRFYRSYLVGGDPERIADIAEFEQSGDWLSFYIDFDGARSVLFWISNEALFRAQGCNYSLVGCNISIRNISEQ